MPEVFLFGGPNGAGKTTLALRLLTQGLSLLEFVNADEIARGLNPLNPNAQTGLASRLAIRRVNTLIEQNRSFAFEGTLAGQWQARALKQCAEKGYQTRLVYLWLPSPEVAIARVTRRVQQGGHDVPETLIRRRYAKGLSNLFHLYLPLMDEVDILNNSRLGGDPTKLLIAQKRNGQVRVHQKTQWRLLCQNP